MQNLGELGYYLLVWLLCVLIGAAIGGKLKGRAFAGGMLGLIGPLGWIIILVFKDLRPKCSECLKALEPGARRCGHCGSLIEAV